MDMKNYRAVLTVLALGLAILTGHGDAATPDRESPRAVATPNPIPDALFQIGIPDASGAELLTFQGLDSVLGEGSWPLQQRAFPDRDRVRVLFAQKEIVYRVGQNQAGDWPFVHPINNCRWSGIPMQRYNHSRPVNKKRLPTRDEG